MSTKEHELRKRLAAVVQDLDRDGPSDPEAIWTIGSLAATLMDRAGVPTWRDLKDGLTAESYDRLLADVVREGNARHAAGDGRKAYACQALGISLACLTQRQDAHFRDGELLLDGIINAAVRLYRETPQAS